MKSKAAVLIRKKKIKLLNINLPSLKKGQILVKIRYTSICYTQIQEIDGLRGKDHYIPHCLGHEATGKVFKVNRKVKKVKPGDNVCLTWVFSKGINAGGSIYSNKKGIINAGPVNTFSQYAIVSENKIHKLNKNSNLKKSVLLGCAAPTAFNCIFLNTKNSIKKKILILGCGGVGLLAVYAAKLMKFREIAVIDKYKKKLKIAKKYGATRSIPLNNLKNFNDYFDYVVECTGNSKLINESLAYVKKFGGQVFVIGNYKHGTKIQIDPWQLLFGKKISGSWEKQFNYDKHFNKFEKYLKKFNSNYFFGKKIYSLKKINSAIKDFKNGKIIRPLIKM